MQCLTLVVNSGSSSVKFALFRDAGAEAPLASLCRGSLEDIGAESSFQLDPAQLPGNTSAAIQAAEKLRFTSVEQAHQALAEWLHAVIPEADIGRVCYRVVQGGDRYHQPTLIDPQVLQDIASLTPFAPLHQPMALNAIEVFRAKYPQATHIACFDTAFHHGMPEVARRFAIPRSFALQGIKPYGFHGLSYQFIASRLAELNPGSMPARVVVAHLGSGASLCALRDGNSIATTMTFTPLDGLPMATRCGAIDAGAVLYMAQEMRLPADEISRILHKESGLLGLSGISGDVRELLPDNSADARFALDFFVYRILSEIGAMLGALQGLDALVFTGGIGAHSWQIRERICAQLSWLGAAIDPVANRANQALIGTAGSQVKLYALKTDEELMMARLAHSLTTPATAT